MNISIYIFSPKKSLYSNPKERQPKYAVYKHTFLMKKQKEKTQGGGVNTK